MNPSPAEKLIPRPRADRGGGESPGTGVAAAAPDPAGVVAPLLLVTGFLGAGKTTVVRQLLPLLDERGLKPFVILNDYENAEVDAGRLRHLADAIEPVSGSCICCDSLDRLDKALLGLTPAAGRVVLIEANGTTDPVALIEHLTVSRQLRNRFQPLMNAAVVHLGAWQQRDQTELNQLEELQVRAATHLVWSHDFGLAPERLAAVTADIGRLNPVGATSAEQLADLLAVVAPQQAGSDASVVEPAARHGHDQHPPKHGHHAHHTHDHHRDHAHDHAHDHGEAHALAHRFVSCQVNLPVLVDGKALLDWLRSLPREILRVKGVARLTQFSDLHFVFQRTSTEPDQPTVFPIPVAPAAPPCAVCIGTSIDERALRRSAELFFGGVPD